MAPKLVQLLRLEAIRLIKLQIEKLNQLTQIPNLLIADSKEAQSYDPDKVHNAISILEGELSKLEELDMVLAVVGTMKAGKSTTINAIVGLEVLPNRSTPMTALPTRIRHVPGQPEPRMQLAKVEPLNRVLHDLATQLAKPEQYKKIEHEERDLKSLADRIKVGMSFATNYQGQENIFSFLKELNDLVRLCKKLECEFPYGDYQNIADLPLIEVAFCHLNEQASNQGHFTLLDTPGPNEMGMPVLKKMMREQLQRASAVMLVMDGTQLNSESDHEVRRELLEIADIAEDHLYVLVNKFDQMDRSFDQEQIQRLVSRNLLMGIKVPESHVFPVSAKFAYLAVLAKHAVTHQRALPDYKQHDWVTEFGNAAFGWSWEDEIFNIEKVEQLTNRLWSKSNFDHPLDEVIGKLRAKAYLLPHASIAAKIVVQGEQMYNFVENCDIALKDEIAMLDNNIRSIEGDIKTIEFSCSQDINEIFHQLKRLPAMVETIIEDAYNTFSDDIYLKVNEIIRRHSISFKEYFRYMALKEKVVFDTHESALNMLKNIDRSIERIFENTCNLIETHLLAEINALETLANLMPDKIRCFNGNSNASFSKKEVEIKIDLSGINLISTNITGSSIITGSSAINEIIIKNTHQVPCMIYSDSPIREFLGWFKHDWGLEKSSWDEHDYHVDMKKVLSFIQQNATQLFITLNQYIENVIIKPLYTSFDRFFVIFQAFANNISVDLIQEVQQLKLDHKQKGELAVQLSDIKAALWAIVLDSQELKHDLARAENDLVTTKGVC